MQERGFKKEHNFIMENRHKVILSGVIDIISFNECEVVVFTELGELKIKGEKLEIINADKDSGDMQLHGRVDGLCYGNSERVANNFLTRLFK
ncbi:MAG: YabP/YqfC family sporulation protein [Oscillospiraceae bacterium]|nr:YabP/YqfC family sporulation protein [Oscillospiraceae bacterium]